MHPETANVVQCVSQCTLRSILYVVPCIRQVWFATYVYTPFVAIRVCVTGLLRALNKLARPCDLALMCISFLFQSCVWYWVVSESKIKIFTSRFRYTVSCHYIVWLVPLGPPDHPLAVLNNSATTENRKKPSKNTMVTSFEDVTLVDFFSFFPDEWRGGGGGGITRMPDEGCRRRIQVACCCVA